MWSVQTISGARLNVIHHLLSRIPYKYVKHTAKRPNLPERQKPEGDVDPNYPFKYVPERC
jgi:polyphosphate kinase